MEERKCEICGHSYFVGNEENEECVMCMLTKIFFGEVLNVYRRDENV